MGTVRKYTLILDREDQPRFELLKARLKGPDHRLLRLCWRLGVEQALGLDEVALLRLASGERPQPAKTSSGSGGAEATLTAKPHPALNIGDLDTLESVEQGREIADTEPPPKPNGILEELPPDTSEDDAKEMEDFLASIPDDPNEAS